MIQILKNVNYKIKLQDKKSDKKEIIKKKLCFASQFDTKIFGIGLSRTGTKSLTIALNSLGYKAAHWKDRDINTILSLEDFYYFDAVTDTCVSYMFETLYHLFPNSKFIYTIRNESDWVKSVSKHFNSSTPKQFKSQYIKDLKSNQTTGKYLQNSYEVQIQYMAIHDVLYGQFDTWLEAYRFHDTRVRNFFKNDSERLLIMNITNGDGWEKLCSFLGKNLPEKPFPKR